MGLGGIFTDIWVLHRLKYACWPHVDISYVPDQHCGPSQLSVCGMSVRSLVRHPTSSAVSSLVSPAISLLLMLLSLILLMLKFSLRHIRVP